MPCFTFSLITNGSDLFVGQKKEIDSETVKSRCDTVFNITLAEMDRAHDERVQDFQKGTKDFLDAQIAYHEKVLVIEFHTLLVPCIRSNFRMIMCTLPPCTHTIFFLSIFFLSIFFLSCMTDAGAFEAGSNGFRPSILR